MAGVTVKADTVTGLVDNGVVTPSGVASGVKFYEAKFYPASGTNPAKVKITMPDNYGFPPGEFLTVRCDLAAGDIPTIDEFTINSFKLVDKSGNAIANATLSVTSNSL